MFEALRKVAFGDGVEQRARAVALLVAQARTAGGTPQLMRDVAYRQGWVDTRALIALERGDIRPCGQRRAAAFNRQIVQCRCHAAVAARVSDVGALVMGRP